SQSPDNRARREIIPLGTRSACPLLLTISVRLAQIGQTAGEEFGDSRLRFREVLGRLALEHVAKTANRSNVALRVGGGLDLVAQVTNVDLDHLLCLAVVDDSLLNLAEE